MAPAATLLQAAGIAYDNLYVKWQLNQLKIRLINFVAGVSPTFPDGDATTRPIGNWLIPIRALGEVIPAVSVELDDLTEAAGMIYRICYLGSQLQANGQISAAQGAALLAQYNGQFA
jgi:hypothetical protein